MWFTGSHCSKAYMNMTLVIDEKLMHFVEGQIIPLRCDNMFCPPPPRVDCYSDPRGICGPDKECWIDQFERTGPWGSSLMRFHNKNLTGATISAGIQTACQNLTMYMEGGGNDESAVQTMVSLCGVLDPLSATATDFFKNDLPRLDEFYGAVRGQCVTPRKRGESCLANRYMNDKLVYREDGTTFERPLFCSSDLQCLNHICVKSSADVAMLHSEIGGVVDEGMFCGTAEGFAFTCKPHLVCTAASSPLEPSTCVKKRPQRVAYLRPWWNSTNCPTMTNATNAQLLLDGLKVLMLTYPGDIGFPHQSSCSEYWMNPVVKETHEVVYNFASALIQNLDDDVLQKDLNATGEFVVPAFDDLWSRLLNVTLEPDTGKCNDTPDSKAGDAKMQLMKFGFQPCYLWSMIHFLTFNQKPVLTEAAAEASRGVGIWLRRYFSCSDCRSAWDHLVKELGMADAQNFSREHHAYWWHHAHNLASEHFASVRGGDQWVAQLWNEEYREYQNPFMMTWEDAEDQWASPFRSSTLV